MKCDQVLQQWGSKSRIFMKRHSATILTCVGAAGVVATTVTAVKATPKAMRLIEEAKVEKGEELTKLELVKAAGPVYIPTLLLGTTTIACVFGANILNKKHQASLVSAYALLDSSYKEYKKKVEELYGEDAKKEITESIAKDHYEDVDLSDLDFEDDAKLFYDSFSEQYFTARPEDVIKAEYDTNKKIFATGSACVNDFYKSLIDSGVSGIDLQHGCDELGWTAGVLESHYWSSWLDFDHYDTDMEDGLQCTIVAFRCEPVIDYLYY